MSINDLIHTNAHNAFEQGVKTERQRIIELLEDYLHKLLYNHGLVIIPEEFDSLVALIKGEQK